MHKSKYGYFVDPEANNPLDFQTVHTESLKGKPHRWLWWVKIPQLRLTKEICYVDPLGVFWHVPSGFVFNGLSVPWWAWPICPTNHPDAFAASVIHDFICTKPYPCDFRYGAFVFWAAMRVNGMYAWGAIRNWFFVRFFGPRFKAKITS